MAFNPFHDFRKHQKAFMAGLVLVCMFTFILSTGSMGSDFFGWLQQTLGGSGKQVEVAKVYGNDVTERDLAILREQRIIANQYMAGAFQMARDDRVRQMLKDNAFIAQIPEQQRFGIVQQMLFEDKEGKELMTRMQTMPFFGGSFDLDGLLDFVIWKHQADRLNIHLTDDDLNAELDRLTFKRFTRRDSAEIETLIRREHPQMTPEVLVNALKEEFRVRLARGTLEGYEAASQAQMPAGGTPDEFWEFYKDHRTEIDVMLFTIPVRDFKVTDTPPEDELKELFNKYKHEEANPASETPGFRQPRRLQLQYLSGRTDSPLMQQMGALELALLQATRPEAYNLALLREYGQQVASKEFDAPSLTDPKFALAYYDGLDRPENTAATAGQIMAALATQAPLVTAAVTYQAGPVARAKPGDATLAEQTRQRIAVGMSLLLAGANPTPPGLEALTVAHEIAYIANLRQTLPLEQVKPRLLARLRDEMTQHFATALFANIQKEFEEKAKKVDTRKETIPAYIDEVVQKFGLKTGVMEQPKSIHDIARDPALEALYSATRGTTASDRRTEESFAGQLFQGDLRLYGLQHQPRFFPEFATAWNTAPERFLYWAIKDESGFTPGALDRVHDQVVSAWQKQKAREMAQKEADELAKLASATKGDVKELNDLEAKSKRTKFVLRGVAKVKENFQTLTSRTGMGRLKAYTDHQEKITYPTPDFIQKLMTLKGKDAEASKGSTLVLTDQPKTNYYVAVVYGVEAPSKDIFFDNYKREVNGSSGTANPHNPLDNPRDTLFFFFEAERRQKYRKDFMDQLRAQAGLQVNEQGRKNFEGRSRDQDAP